MRNTMKAFATIPRKKVDYSYNVKPEEVISNPFSKLQNWLNFASEIDPNYENNMVVLSTSTKDGFPTSRYVLVKNLEGDKITFFSNYESKKGEDIEKNSQVHLNFFWPQIQRQVRINGLAKKTSKEISQSYFMERDAGSRLAVSLSSQSQKMNDEEKKLFEDNFKKQLKEEKEFTQVPDYWGGYEITPTRYEFWRGREFRLHDRLVYEFDSGKWNTFWLQP